MEKISWFRTEYGIFGKKEMNLKTICKLQVHLTGGYSSVPVASRGHHNSLLSYLCLPEGRRRNGSVLTK